MDEAHKETDKLISSLEKRISSTYNRASQEAQDKLDKYLASFAWKDEAKRAKLKAGEITQKEYDYWRTGQIMIGKRWEEVRDSLTSDFVYADKISQSISKGYMEEAYAINHNYATFEVEKQSLVDTSYTLYDRHTVENLIKNEPDLLPPPNPKGKTARKLREGKLIRWNKQKITAEVTQGILQGESVDKIAKRMRNVANMDKRASIRNARTAMTGAQNAGRQAGYERAKGMGIDTEKQWLAVMDGRTRHEHRILDGQHVPVDKKFKVSNYELEFPADPKADPEMVYNCRCTMICRLKGFEDDFTDRRNPELGDMTYDEWKNEHSRTPKQEDTGFKVVNGSDITSTWTRREDKFDFAIDDIINAQGFDGLPRVVSADEFEKYVKDSNFIAQRTYSAPDQETLDAYRDQLYHGKWYVDCSTGGAAHGKGMYCVGNNGTDVTEKMKNSMTSYGGMSPNANIETFTLDNTAKIIKENDIKDLYPDLGINLMKRNLDGYNFSDDEIKFIASYGGIGDANYVSDFLNNNSKRAMEIMQEVASNKKIADTVTEFIKITNDNGVVASMFGYDAIECAGSQDYYVILNRTKCIFKGE